MFRSLVRILAPVIVTLVAVADTGAQVIPVRTIPVATGDQFLLVPSKALGMGGVTYALDDSLGDAWANPAKGIFVTESAFFSSPTIYSISHGGGGARTVPVGGFLAGGGWSGGVVLALQQLDNSESRSWGCCWPVFEPFAQWAYLPPNDLLSDANARNLYAQAFLARRVGTGPWSVGLGASASSLDAMDGVDLLYNNATRVVQSGGTDDVRLGLYRRGARDRVSLVAARDHVSMTHDATYIEVYWPTPQPGGEVPGPTTVAHVEHNLDETTTWAFQAAWDRDLAAPGWRAGLSATVNRKSHPEIPNYDLQNIPRDPGTTWAYELGAGLSQTTGPTTFGVDVAFQPIWSNTWQVADTAVSTPSDGVIPAGRKTLENDFSFQNVLLRVGLSQDVRRATVQIGLEVRSYDYDLNQKDHVAGTFRDQTERWMEWTPTAGAALHLRNLEVRYSGSVTTGTGRPGVTLAAAVPVADQATFANSDFLVAPQGPLTLQDASVWTHQLSVRVPIR